MKQKDLLLRPIWRPVFGETWRLSAMLFVLLGFLRSYGILGPATESVRRLILLNFFIMWFLPFIFLTKNGRRTIGLRKIEHPIWFLWGPLCGAVTALLIFTAGFWLYGRSMNNWFVFIGRYQLLIDQSVLRLPKTIVIPIFTIPAMLFSPIGEEFFFRGLLHESVKIRWGERVATLANSLAFSGAHLLHFGIMRDAGDWHVLPVPGVLWFLLIMGTSWLFTVCRRQSGSIWPAVCSHSAFNLIMSFSLFFYLLW